MQSYIPSEVPRDNALWRHAGFPSDNGRELIMMLQTGLPVSVLDSIRDWMQIPRSDLLKITGLNERNITRRKSSGSALTSDESERVARLVRVMDAAVRLFAGNKQDAERWLQNPVKGLSNVAPVSLLASESGALEVLDLIGRLEHGVWS